MNFDEQSWAVAMDGSAHARKNFYFVTFEVHAHQVHRLGRILGNQGVQCADRYVEISCWPGNRAKGMPIRLFGNPQWKCAIAVADRNLMELTVVIAVCAQVIEEKPGVSRLRLNGDHFASRANTLCFKQGEVSDVAADIHDGHSGLQGLC